MSSEPIQREPTRREPVLGEPVLVDVDAQLRATDTLLAEQYPGERDVRQPVHTVYVPADRWEPGLAADWGRQALAAVQEHGGMEALAARVVEQSRQGRPQGGSGAAGDREEVEQLARAVTAKLESEPIEDLRIDFEDGFGRRPDEEEDRWAVEAARRTAQAVAEGRAPAFIGIRFKCLEADVRRRGLRTLDLYLGHLLEAGEGLPEGLTLTLPKVSTADQVRAMVDVARALEVGHGLPEGRLGFEIQVETPQLVLGADGTVPLAQSLHAGRGRVTSLHYGTYDYSASLGISAGQQAMDHPAADFAKHQMQLAAAGTGVHVSDGSTNILPLGDADQVHRAWELHGRLVRRHLERGIHQGWDLHPHQLPTRFLATFQFFRQGFADVAERLAAYVGQVSGAVLDEPATAKAMAGHIERGLVCGAVAEQELTAATGLDRAGLRAVARTGLPPEADGGA